MEMSHNDAIVRTEQVTRLYHVGTREIPALRGVDLAVGAGRVVALRGRSGSGKTTLLNCIGGLDRPTGGRIWFEGREVTGLSEPQALEVTNKLLLEVYDDQKNIVSVFGPGDKKGLLLFQRGKTTERIEF